MSKKRGSYQIVGLFFAGEIIDTYSNGSNVLKKKNEVQDCTIDLKYYFIGAGYFLFNY